VLLEEADALFDDAGQPPDADRCRAQLAGERRPRLNL
jgi:hypothetical protein